MLWARQMGIALVSFVIASAGIGIGGAVMAAIGVAFRPGDPIGSVVSLGILVAGAYVAHRIYVVLDHADALRSGRLPRS